MNEGLLKLFTKDGQKALLKSKTAEELKNSLKNVHLFYKDDMQSLKNMSKRKLFGMALHCMNVGDWENTKGPEYNKEGRENQIEKINPKSIFVQHFKTRNYLAPQNTDSSTMMSYLSSVVDTTME